MKNLIITADDYGYLDNIDDAILELAAEYRISSVSCFANQDIQALTNKIDKLVHIKDQLAAKGKNLGIGLHFTITSGYPVGGKPSSLTEYVNGKYRFKLIKDQRLWRIDPDDVRFELNAQLNQLKSALGGRSAIDHVSNHHNICYFKRNLFKAYIHTIRDAAPQVPIRSPLRWKMFNGSIIDIEKGTKALRRRGLKIKPEGSIWQFCYTQKKGMRRFADFAKDKGVQFPDHFFSEFYENPSLRMANALNTALNERLECEVIAHVSNGKFRNKSYHGINAGYFLGRQKEYEMFAGKGDKKPNFYNERDVFLTSYLDHLNEQILA